MPTYPERVRDLEANRKKLLGLLARVEIELAPNHDEALALSRKLGLGDTSSAAFIAEIRAALKEKV